MDVVRCYHSLNECQPSASPQRYTTPYNRTAPPRNARATVDHHAKTLNISWEHSCHIHGQHPHLYMIRVKDLTSNNTHNIKVNANDDAIQHYQFANITDTSKFLVSISTLELDAESTELLVHGYQLPSPKWLTIRVVDNHTYLMDWEKVNYTEAP